MKPTPQVRKFIQCLVARVCHHASAAEDRTPTGAITLARFDTRRELAMYRAPCKTTSDPLQYVFATTHSTYSLRCSHSYQGPERHRHAVCSAGGYYRALSAPR